MPLGTLGPLGAINPIDNPGAWDVVVIAGQQSPGICELGDVKRAHEWDVKKGKGSLAATTTFVGRPPAKFTITFRLWQSDHFAAWDDFVLLLQYNPTKKAVAAVDIYHPALAFAGIHSVVTESIGAPHHEGDGMYTIAIEFLEYFPAPKVSAVSTPTTSTTNSGDSGGVPGTPPDPAVQKAQDDFNSALNDAKNLGSP